MIRTVAVQGYRSLRDLALPLGQLSLITGANGSGKSSVYRSLRLLADAAQNAVVASLAAEGGLPAALLSPRPPQLMVLNEPETSLHPDLLPALARLILAAAEQTQIIVVSHAPQLIEVLSAAPLCRRLHLVKELGETMLEEATLFNKPKWVWPAR